MNVGHRGMIKKLNNHLHMNNDIHFDFLPLVELNSIDGCVILLLMDRFEM